MLPDILPCTPGYHKAGIIKWVYAYDESNWPVHEQIQNIEDGYIVYIDSYHCNGRAIFGQLVSKYLLLYHQSEAIIVQGKIRDAAAIIREKWPIWCSGYTPIGCFNDKPVHEIDQEWKNEHRNYYDGAIAVCDDCGVVVIPKEFHNETFLASLFSIEEQEDIWFERLDHYKENTFDIVCRKKYLNDKAYMLMRGKTET